MPANCGMYGHSTSSYQLTADSQVMSTYVIRLHLPDKCACTFVRQTITEEHDHTQLQHSTDGEHSLKSAGKICTIMLRR